MRLTTLIWLALALIGMGFIGQLVANDAGYVLFQYGSWRLETSIWVAAVALLLIYGVLRGLAWLLSRHHWLRQFADWRAKRSQVRANASLEQGVMAYLDERYQPAQRYFEKSTNGEQAWFGDLMSARSAWAQGHHTTALHFLDRGKAQAPKLSLLFELQRIELLREQGKLEQAFAVAKSLAEHYPKNGYVTKQLLTLSIALKDGGAVMEALPRLLHSQLPGRRSENQRLLRQLTQRVPDWLHNCLDEKHQKSLMQLWYQLDKSTQARPELAGALARLLAAQQANKQAVAILRHALKHAVKDELLVLYSEIIDDAQQQMQDLEVLLKEEPNHPAGLFSAGRLCLHLQLWGKAKDYLTRSLAHKETPSVRLALLALGQATQDPKMIQQQQQALLAPQLQALQLDQLQTRLRPSDLAR